MRLAVRGDPVRLRQVLTNLVSNAIKFTQRGSVALHVSKRGETRTHFEILFAVKDTGVGIAPEAATKLFQPFSQADASTTRMHGGTGLGLVICKRIVDLMGGKIGVRSELGKGSLFWFSVPLSKALGDVTSHRRDIHGARALVITSDANSMRRLSSYFAAWGVTFLQTRRARGCAQQGALGGEHGRQLGLRFPDRRRCRAARRERDRLVAQCVARSGAQSRAVPVSAGRRSGAAGIERRTARRRDPAPIRRRRIARGDVAPARRQRTGRRRAWSRRRPTTSGDAAYTSNRRKPSALPVGGHVLLVEDNAVNRQVAQRLLTLIGISYEIAENGKEALDAIAARAFDGVLMDCQMPVMDGYTATRIQRQNEGQSGKHIPIIAMTANAMAGDREKCLKAGMDDYLSKPLNRALLEQTLRKWLPAGAKSRPTRAAACHADASAARAHRATGDRSVHHHRAGAVAGAGYRRDPRSRRSDGRRIHRSGARLS